LHSIRSVTRRQLSHNKYGKISFPRREKEITADAQELAHQRLFILFAAEVNSAKTAGNSEKTNPKHQLSRPETVVKLLKDKKVSEVPAHSLSTNNDLMFTQQITWGKKRWRDGSVSISAHSARHLYYTDRYRHFKIHDGECNVIARGLHLKIRV
jgi:hypothetical protein